MSVHSKTQLTNVERLAYLRHALKDRLANQAIEGMIGRSAQRSYMYWVFQKALRPTSPYTSSARLHHPQCPSCEGTNLQGSAPPTRRR